MKNLKFRVSPIEGDVMEGVASRVFVNDANTVLTISEQHAPLISTLSRGLVSIDAEQGKLDFSFEQGYLRVQNNLCAITLLK